MKKTTILSIITLALVVIFTLTITSCTTNNDAPVDTTEPETIDTTEPETIDTTEPETTDDSVIMCPHSLSHDFQIVEYTANFHVLECDYCGIQATENHILADEIFDNQHTLGCQCGYVSTLHIGVEYTELEDGHQGTCKCGYSIIEEHELMDFECYDCEFKINGSIYGIIESVNYRQNHSRIYLLTAEENYRLKDYKENTCYNEGDFVVIKHEGEFVTDISVIVNSEIIHDVEDFSCYISNDIYESSYDLELEDLIVDEVQFNEIVEITFRTGNRSFIGFNDYIVFDILECEVGELEEDYAYLTLVTEDMIYFICFW